MAADIAWSRNWLSMATSISRRVFTIFFWSNVLSLLLVIAVAWGGLEALEATVLEMDQQAELEHFQSRYDPDKPQFNQTATLTMFYWPGEAPPEEKLPAVFRGLTAPYNGEVDVDGKDYEILVNQVPGGVYYLAKDLALFEQRETQSTIVILGLALLVCALSFFTARLASRKISRPLQGLTGDIDAAAPTGGFRLPLDYPDSELTQISQAINKFLDQIDELVKRERSLVSLASHELRTPIAVILGAVEVIEHRNKLSAEDKKTLGRISASAQEMSANVQALLKLVRRTKEPYVPVSFPVGDILKELAQEHGLSATENEGRLELSLSAQQPVALGDPVLAKILINNLIINALNHTQGQVYVTEYVKHLEIRDEGAGNINGFSQEAPSSSGLGLFIVTLVCEHMGWRYELTTDESGSRVKVWFLAA